ncbi:pseudouridine synthase [Legionella geestiana]|uniref:Pseudouridine synthase n=1 Tax=Legionella geestiana TaxID=45065 RepID=A0A0W0TPB1_9GAMM|nr:pseudouridine synthase [Legionella geestiana]KTC97438.1 pseudouridine synthase [Legionella geestiana]QBS11257.1 pseudouridine synthase [Legionella geestiana]QDQ40952.1 pseudouridine synthase [Legionella geestiana]STX54115.1 ribosomal large subunit pseudouridine synthase B [Legionella geestiana]
MTVERLQKILAQKGLASRREAERWIAEGLVTVNGVVAKTGDSASETDRIAVRGKVLDDARTRKPSTRVLLYHKPVGEISSRSDPKHTRTVFDNLPPLREGRWVQVGRLDINTSGLLIFTTNGELANRMMHPRFEMEREYAVRVRGEVTDEMVNALLRGVTLEDGPARFKKVQFRGGEGTNAWYHVVLTEGKNREVRRLWNSLGVEVSRLIRIRYGKIHMPRSLARGESVEMGRKEVAALLQEMGIAAEVVPPSRNPRRRKS